MKLVALIIIPIVIWFYSTKCYSHAENVTIWVIRRYSGDFYSWKLSNSHEVCDHNRPTYMVEEQQCVQNDDLLDSKYF